MSVYVKDYFVHADTNCYSGNGATCLPSDCSSYMAVQTKEDCVEYCEADSQCAAAVHNAKRCWKRADIDLKACKTSNVGDTLLVKPTASRPLGTQGPLLYAATLSQGSMPPLFGY